MEIPSTRQLALLVLVALMSASPAVGDEFFAGTRPGIGDEPLNLTGTLILLDVSKIDGAEQSFTADVFMMLQWRDERLAMEIDGIRRLPLDSIWNPRVQIVNQRRVFKTFDDIVDVMPDGTVTYRQRFFGAFASPLDLRDFPLDRHRFRIQVVVPGYNPEEIDFVPNSEGVGDGRSLKLTVPDWSVSAFKVDSVPFAVIHGGPQIAGIEGSFEARRHLGFYVGKAFVSVAIIVFMSWIVFWIGAEHVGPRLSVAVTSMLTLVAYRFLLGQSLPPVSYLTRLDYFLLGSTILVFIALIQVALTSSSAVERAASINRHSRWIFPAFFVVLVGWSFLLM